MKTFLNFNLSKHNSIGSSKKIHLLQTAYSQYGKENNLVLLTNFRVLDCKFPI